MSAVYNAKVLLANNVSEDLAMSVSSSPPWTLRCTGIGMKDQLFAGENLFDALLLLRRQLDDMGCRLLCAGARRDVYPSAMARAMGGARKAYVHELGKSAVEIVDIFDEAQPEQVGTVDEQKHFREKWIASLRENLQ